MIHPLLRVVDANLNRVTEGLRVAEDVCRYAWNNKGLALMMREARHRVSTLVEREAYAAARNVASDVLARAGGSPDAAGRDPAAIVRVNLKRAEEGLRVLEEVFRTEDGALAGRFEELRYRVYHMERSALAALRPRLGRGLYLILNAPSGRMEELALCAVANGISAVQLRCKEAGDRVFLEEARRLKRLIEVGSTLLIVNDWPDIALMSRAHGVHLGQDDLDPREARDLMGPEAVIGLSTHNMAQVLEANDLPVDYIGFGPVFKPFSKEDHEPPTGMDALREAVSVSSMPVVAIGGITTESAPRLGATGCHGIAVIGAVESASDPSRAIETLNRGFLEGT